MIKIYNYHAITKEFISESVTGLDPIEQQPMIPAFATMLVPPATGDNERAVFIDGTWQVVCDYRQTEYWQQDGTHHVIAELGIEPPCDALFSPPMAHSKQQNREVIIRCITQARAKLTGHADPYQLVGWNDKAQRAQRLLTKGAYAGDINILQAECDQRGKGETPQELAHKQVNKSHRLASAFATLDGMQSAAVEALESDDDHEAVLATLEHNLANLLASFDSDQATVTQDNLLTRCKNTLSLSKGLFRSQHRKSGNQ